MSDEFFTADGISLARETQAKLVDGAQTDAEAGDMHDGWHAFRLGAIVVVSRPDGPPGARRFKSSEAADEALAEL